MRTALHRQAWRRENNAGPIDRLKVAVEEFWGLQIPTYGGGENSLIETLNHSFIHTYMHIHASCCIRCWHTLHFFLHSYIPKWIFMPMKS